MRAGSVLKLLLAACVAAGVGWWLFADTVRYHSRTDESGPLRVSFWGDFVEYRMWRAFLADWQGKHPDLPVKLEYIPGSLYGQKIQQLLVADAAPDVILFQDEPMPAFIEMGEFEDLTKYLNTPGLEIDPSAMWATAVELFGRHEDKGQKRTWCQYGMPVWGGCNLVVYNREAFERAGIRVESAPVQPDPKTGRLPPGLRRDGKTWVLNDECWTVEEFLKVCHRLTVDSDDDGRIDRFGFLHPGTTYWLPWHWALGARILDEERKHTAYFGPQCERSLTVWQDLRYSKHPVCPTPAELGVMGQNVGFLTGRIAMISQGPWVMPFFNDTDAPYGVLHTPRGPDGTRATRITWDAVVMFRGSKKKDLAWRFIHHMVGDRCQQILAEFQRSIPARKSACDAFIRANPSVEAGKFVQAAAEYARVQPITEHWEVMYGVWLDSADGLRDPRSAARLTPAESIGRFYSEVDKNHKELHRRLPPADRAEADRYVRIYEARGKPRRGSRP